MFDPHAARLEAAIADATAAGWTPEAPDYAAALAVPADAELAATVPATELAHRLDHCPQCGRRIGDHDDDGVELDNGQRWCVADLGRRIADKVTDR